MKPEIEMIYAKLANVRDNIFDKSDYVSDEGYDLTGSYAGSPFEVLCGMEEKIVRQQKELEIIKQTSNYIAGFKQGEFEMMIELIHGSYDREEKLMEIRKEIIERYKS